MIDVELAPDLDTSQEVSLSEQLEETPPGPQLASLLATVDRAGLDSDDLLRLVAARQRLIAHHEAQTLAELHTIARMIPKGAPLPNSVARERGKYPWAEVECAFALRWTHARAAGQLILADEVIDRLPVVFAALNAGDIDIPKALAIADLLGCVDDTLAAAVAGKVIDQAKTQTTAQLRARLRRLLIAADPNLAAKKAHRAIKDRRVAAYTDDHTHLASLAGYELAPQRVAAVMERLDAIAKACKAAGDARTMDQIRADAFLDLVSGQGVALGGEVSDGSLGMSADINPADDPDADTAAEVPWPAQPPDQDLDPEMADPAAEAQPSDPPPGDVVVDDPGEVVDLWAFGIGTPPAEQACRDGHDHGEEVERRRWLADFDNLPTTRPVTRCVRCGHLDGAPPAPGALPGPRAGVVEITISLETLLGLADLPAELAGYGPLIADIARQVVTQMRNATWRYTIHDPLCRLVHHGTTTARPSDGSDECQHHTPRRPNAELAALIKARDRTCVAAGCRRSARRCDIDHSLDWVKGGETVHCNLELLCRLHHLFKHATGCELIQISPGVFGWTTPAGLQYLTRSGPPLIQANDLAGLPQPGKPANPDIALLQAAQQRAIPVLASPTDLFDPDEFVTEEPDAGG